MTEHADAKESVLPRRAVLAVGAAAALAGGGLAAWRWRATEALPLADEAFWDHTFEGADGGDLRMAQWRGQPLLVNFWATWCPPCVRELPLLSDFSRQQPSNGLKVLGLAVDQPSSVKRFLARQPLSFPVGLAGLEGSALVKTLGNPAGGLPFSVLFAANGRILDKKLGEMSAQDLDRWVGLVASPR